MVNLAIISPSQNAYSETFIHAHKGIPGVKVFYYYGGSIPKYLEGAGELVSQKIGPKICRHVFHRLYRTGLNLAEEALMRSLKREKIDCVLAEYGITAAKVLFVCKKLNIPLIAHFHGYDASISALIEENRESFKKMFSYASSVIAVSRVMEKKLLDLGCPVGKIFYNPYGPDDAFLKIIPEYTKKQFIGIGRFVDKKAPYYTLLAFYKALQERPEISLVIAGDGPLLNTCINLVKYLEIGDNVSFPGIITPEQYRAYLKESIAFVQHSITAENGDMEGTPVGILEASAAGLPVISTFHAGIPEVIIQGKTGLLCDEHDVNQMAANMLCVLDEKKRAIDMGAAGKENIRDNFSMYQHLRVLGTLINNNTIQTK